MAYEVTTVKRSVDDLQVKRLVRATVVKAKFASQKTFENARFAVSKVNSSSSGFPDPSDGLPTVQNGFIAEGSPWYPCTSTSKGDRGPFVLQGIEALCQDHVLSVLSDVQAVQILTKGASPVTGSSRGGVQSMLKHNPICDTDTAKPKESLKASEDKLYASQH